MYKNFFVHLITVQLFSFFTFVMLSSSLYGMDKDYDFVIKQVLIPNIDHNAQRIFAVLNKTYNNIIENNYRPHKKRIELFMQEEAKFPSRRLWNKGFSRQGSCSQDFSRQISWNKDFSMCAWLNVKSTGHGRKSWGLTLIGFDDKDMIVEQHTKKFHGFYFPVIDGNIRPFFNKQGAACFHAYVDTHIQVLYGSALTESVMELSIDLVGTVKGQRCFFECYNSSKDNFYYILNFPLLVQALLRSTQVRNYRMLCGNDTAKLYHLSGVMLPQDYKTFKKHVGLENNPNASYDTMADEWRKDCYSSYEALPNAFKNDINKRYIEQEFDRMMVDIE